MTHTVGLVTDNAAALIQLRQALTSIEHTVAYTLTADQVAHSRPLKPSLWVVISEEAADIFDRLNQWSEAPVFLADDIPNESEHDYFLYWQDNLVKKLTHVLSNLPDKLNEFVPDASPINQFKAVWVLASSLGGPEAIKQFLSYLHPELPIAFIYAQHIDDNFDKILPAAIGKNSSFSVSYAADGDFLQPGHVTVIPSHQLAEIDARGRIHIFADRSWDKPYTPNINQVIENIADNFSQRMGVIIFSGMCDDGASTSIELSKQNIPVWAQKPEDCICPAMPQAVIDAQAAKYIGSTFELAKHLNNHYGKLSANGSDNLCQLSK